MGLKRWKRGRPEQDSRSYGNQAGQAIPKGAWQLRHRRCKDRRQRWRRGGK